MRVFLLAGRELDFAVWACEEGVQEEPLLQRSAHGAAFLHRTGFLKYMHSGVPAYSSDPCLAYPIIVREQIDTSYGYGRWSAVGRFPGSNRHWRGEWIVDGSTPLEAAMRAFVLNRSRDWDEHALVLAVQ